MSALTIALVFAMTMIALAFDAKACDSHSLKVRRLYRKIRRVQEANKATELDNLFYKNQIGK